MSVLEARFVCGVIAGLVWGLWVCPQAGLAASKENKALAARKAEAEQFFSKQIKPFIKKYCIDCHQNRRPTEAGLSFDPALRSPGHAAFSEKKSRRPA